MVEAGAWVVVDVVRQHRPDLPGVLVGNRHDDLAEGHASVERAYPQLFRRGLFRGDRLGTLQAAAGALDQQGAQVGIAATADLGKRAPKPPCPRMSQPLP